MKWLSTGASFHNAPPKLSWHDVFKLQISWHYALACALSLREKCLGGIWSWLKPLMVKKKFVLISSALFKIKHNLSSNFFMSSIWFWGTHAMTLKKKNYSNINQASQVLAGAKIRFLRPDSWCKVCLFVKTVIMPKKYINK